MIWSYLVGIMYVSIIPSIDEMLYQVQTKGVIQLVTG